MRSIKESRRVSPTRNTSLEAVVAPGAGLRCSYCDRCFKTPGQLHQHETRHSRPWKCSTPICRYNTVGFPSRSDRDRHFNETHKAEPVLFHCVYARCGFASKRSSNCRVHMENVHKHTVSRVRRLSRRRPRAESGNKVYEEGPETLDTLEDFDLQRPASTQRFSSRLSPSPANDLDFNRKNNCATSDPYLNSLTREKAWMNQWANGLYAPGSGTNSDTWQHLYSSLATSDLCTKDSWNSDSAIGLSIPEELTLSSSEPLRMDESPFSLFPSTRTRKIIRQRPQKGPEASHYTYMKSGFGHDPHYKTSSAKIDTLKRESEPRIDEPLRFDSHSRRTERESSARTYSSAATQSSDVDSMSTTSDTTLGPLGQALVVQLLARFWSSFPQLKSCSPGQHSESNSSAYTGSTLSRHGQRTSTAEKKQTEGKRKALDYDDNNEDEDDNHHPSRSPKRVRIKRPIYGPLFACHYLKYNPELHSKCYGAMLQKSFRIKQHFRLCHLVYTCPKCQSSYATLEKRNYHIRKEKCAEKEKPRISEGVTEEQYQLLDTRLSSHMDEEQKWFKMWEILFEDEPKPESPYSDFTLSSHGRSFQRFLSSAAARNIIETDLRNKHLELSQDYGGDIRAYIGAVIDDCIQHIFQTWAVGYTPANDTPGDPQPQNYPNAAAEAAQQPSLDRQPSALTAPPPTSAQITSAVHTQSSPPQISNNLDAATRFDQNLDQNAMGEEIDSGIAMWTGNPSPPKENTPPLSFLGDVSEAINDVLGHPHPGQFSTQDEDFDLLFSI